MTHMVYEIEILKDRFGRVFFLDRVDLRTAKFTYLNQK